MAPALTAEPLSPKEKLTSTASPSARSDNNNSSAGSAAVKQKPSTPTTAAASTRVTRSKSASNSPIVVQSTTHSNNKRKSLTTCKPSNDPAMGLSAAPTHATTATASTATTTSTGEAVVVASTSTSCPSPAATAEQNNNNNNNSSSKDNSTAQLLADLTSDFEEAISAEICLRNTLPEVGLGKEAPAPASAGAAVETSTSKAAASATPAEQEAEKIEERLSQLDGSAPAPVRVEECPLPPPSITEEPSTAPPPPPLPSSAASLPTTPVKQQQPPLPASVLSSPLTRQQQQQQHLTPQSVASSSSINFLKDGAAGAVLEDQDIEEVLKALKTFDGGQVNADAICDFNFFNEVWEEPPATAATSQVLPESIVEDSKPITTSVNAPRPLPESQLELEEQQHVLCRKIDFLLRRMRKFQARQMCRHTSEEVAGILEWSARSSHKAPNPVRTSQLSEQESTVMSIVSGRPYSNFWEEQCKQPLPAIQMSNVIQHIGTAARHQQICHTTSGSSATLASSALWYNNSSSSSSSTLPGKRPRKNQQDVVAGGTTERTTTTTTNAPQADDIVPSYDTYVTSELTHVAGLLHTEMCEVQQAIDSDATESSSGGESADEMVTYNNSQQLSLSITRRAVWRYSRDRAAIALRWSWLCAQLADLDMKIRQHIDLFAELTQNKGPVQLEGATPKSQTTSQTAPANGYKDESITSNTGDWSCSRVRPLVLTEFRKRKLFQTTNMHAISKKAARPSNIKCGCQWPQVPCTLCTGRTDPTAPRELPETMMSQNRVALLDPGYHPVLSFKDDVSQSVHLEAISRQPDWQYRVMRCQAKAIVKSVYKAEREAMAHSGGAGAGSAASGRRPGDATVKRRYVRRKERNNNSNKEAAAAAASGGGAVDSGNGTGTATTTTSSSTTPTTTPLVANSKLFSGQEAKAPPAANWEQQFQLAVARLSPTPTAQQQPSSLLNDLQQRQQRR